MSIAGKTIALGITGGIAAYRACDVIRELYRRGAARVVVCQTPEANEFITPLTLESLSGYPLWQDVTSVPLWPTLGQSPPAHKPFAQPGHIWLAQQADVFVILPATANLLAKLAHGLADCPVSLTALTMTGKPVILMPAMNTRMWLNPATQRNLNTLQDNPDVTIIPPTDGLLACGETGAGHLAPDDLLFAQLERVLSDQVGALNHIKALVTAGGTQEPLDAVRVLSNRSSGKMGLAMADALFAAGAEVTLLTSQSPVPIRPYTVKSFTTSHDLSQDLDAFFPACDLLVMAAAVSDFGLRDPLSQKFKKSTAPEGWTLNLTPMPDLLASLSARQRGDQFLVGFAAEMQKNLLAYAQEKLARKLLDAVVANAIDQPETGFEGDENVGLLLFANQATPMVLERSSKSAMAKAIVSFLIPRLQSPVIASECSERGNPVTSLDHGWIASSPLRGSSQ